VSASAIANLISQVKQQPNPTPRTDSKTIHTTALKTVF